MKSDNSWVTLTRRRFMVLLGGLGLAAPGWVKAQPKSRLSEREAAFYKKL